MASGNQPKFEFISCSGHKNDKLSLPRVRKHVMHDYFRRQGTSEKDNATAQRKSRRKREPKRASNREAPSGPLCTITVPGASHACAGPDMLREDQPSDGNSTSTTDTEHYASMPSARANSIIYQQLLKNDFKRLPDALRLDPFDTLPVKGITNDLAQWHFALCDCYKSTSPWVYATNVGVAGLMWRSAVQDQGLFHILLSQAEWNRLIVTRSTDKSKYLFHKGRALQILRDRITAEVDNVSDRLILLVSSQINHALADGEFETARSHLRAASALRSQMKGKLSDMVWMHAMIMDIKAAAVSLSLPVWKDFNGGLPHVVPASSILRETIERRTAITLRTFPQDFSTSNDILYGLHWVALAFDARYASFMDTASVVICHMRLTNILIRLVVDECNSTAIHRGDISSRPRATLILCLHFIAWSHHPSKSTPWFHSMFMNHLARALKPKLIKLLGLQRGVSHEDLVDTWTGSGASPLSLLWILFVGTAMVCIADHVPGNSNTSFASTHASLPFIRAMKAIAEDLLIFDLASLQQALKLFPWTEDFCGTWSRLIGAQLHLDDVDDEDCVGWPPFDLDLCYNGGCSRRDVHFHLQSHATLAT